MSVEQTLVLCKPDAVQRSLVGQIVSRFEQRGLQIAALKMLQVTPELAAQHYAEHVEKPFYPSLEGFITSGPVVAMVIQGPSAISVVRAMMGPTNGQNAPSGTIRGDYGVDQQMNLVHGSDGPDAAAREIGLYFKSSEVLEYTPALASWVCHEGD